MIFTATVVIPKNTTKESPYQQTVKLTYCVIDGVRVEIPLGVMWLAGIRMMVGGHQLYPTTNDEWITGNNSNIEWTDRYTLGDGIFEIEIIAYNLDQYYDHTIRVWFDVSERIDDSQTDYSLPVGSGTLGV